MDTTRMNLPIAQHSASDTVEGIARVIGVDGDTVWLEPEQTSSCGSCASSAACSGASPQAPGIGTVTSRLQARRFSLANLPAPHALRVGERIVIGVDHRALIKAALMAYAVPLAVALCTAGLVQDAWGSDLLSVFGMAGGLCLGLLVARVGARRLAAQGALAPRFLRRAKPGETCGSA